MIHGVVFKHQNSVATSKCEIMDKKFPPLSRAPNVDCSAFVADLKTPHHIPYHFSMACSFFAPISLLQDSLSVNLVFPEIAPNARAYRPTKAK